MSFKFKPVGHGGTVGSPSLYDIYDTAPSGYKVGSTIKGVGVNNEQGEFILLYGATSMSVGNVCGYNGYTGVVNRAPGANTNLPIAVSLTANTDPLKLSWYQITGNAVATVGSPAAGSLLWHNIGGALFTTATSGKQVLGAVCGSVANIIIDGTAIGAANAVVHLSLGTRMQGQIT
jgi:hypothetical protein